MSTADFLMVLKVFFNRSCTETGTINRFCKYKLSTLVECPVNPSSTELHMSLQVHIHSTWSLDSSNGYE